MTDVAALTERIEPRVTPSPVPGLEHTTGWGIVAFPFDTGHVLALRVFPQNDFAPFVSIWHRTPDGGWSIYVDGPALETACPRYFGDATERSWLTDVDLTWTSPCDLTVEVANPSLVWTASVDPGPLVTAVNAVSRRVPEPLLRTRPMVGLMERVGRHLFGLGDLTLASRVPNGQFATMLPRRLYPIVAGSARLEGEDLGRPADGGENPTIGDLRLPARPVMAIGRAYVTIEDAAAYARLVEASLAAADESTTTVG